MRQLRAILLLLIGGFVALEGANWARSLLTTVHFHAYPRIVLDGTGELLLVRRDAGAPGRGFLRRWVEMDAARKVVRVIVQKSGERTPEDSPDRRAILELDAAPLLAPGPWNGLTGDPPYWLRPSDIDDGQMIPAALNGLEQNRRKLQGADQALRCPVVWSFEAGRYVCRLRDGGEAVAGFGPDGFVRGAGAGAGNRFGRLHRVSGFLPSWILWQTPEGRGKDRGRFAGGDSRTVLLDVDSGKLVEVSLVLSGEAGAELRPLPAASVEPVEVRVRLGDFGRVQRWISRLRRTIGALVLVDDRLCLVDGDGEIVEQTPWLGEQEYIAAINEGDGLDVTVVTCVGRARPDRVRLRIHHFGAAKPTVAEIRLQPSTPGERFRAQLLGLLASPRPLPLGVAAAVSAAPNSFAEMAGWWWRDPYFAEGRGLYWLAVSALLALACAWLARRSARVRCARLGAVRFWALACFLLGPLGLLWMRFCLPRVPVAAVGNARRAVNLEACPETDAPWPEPAPLDIEVISPAHP